MSRPRAQVAAVQFHLINSTILLLSREGFRRGCLRAEEVRKLLITCVLSFTSDTLPGARHWAASPALTLEAAQALSQLRTMLALVQVQGRVSRGRTLATVALSFPVGCLVTAVTCWAFRRSAVLAGHPRAVAMQGAPGPRLHSTCCHNA